MKRGRIAAALIASCLPLWAAASDARSWNFDARLDGKPIGTHRFTVSGPGARREVDSEARFDVKLLGIVVYRYRHEAHERWQGDCLRELQSRTDDDGKPLQVEQKPGGCAMSFAYWHPRLQEQTSLINPQTGLAEAVRFERLPDATIPVQGREVAATRWRLSTPTQTLTVWRDRANDDWIGLDARVSGDRLLTYRLP
jgi:hypothetical protein